MITVTDKRECCGCGACVQRCPKHCLTMREDEEGFLYPVADASLCIECGLCERVCPVINQGEARDPMQAFAAKNPDESVRQQSSSGGIFTLLAERVIGEGGVVFGAKWTEDFSVVHGYAETVEALSSFRSSKYLQSRIGESYIQAERFLKAGRTVLYSGTPCQIAGLRKFLRKEYENLLAVECICHSVPSPRVWQAYLDEKCAQLRWKRDSICRVNFRNKRNGWKGYQFELGNNEGKVHFEAHGCNAYMRGFLSGLYTRPSCHACPAKSLRSGADITLGDFWGIGTLLPEMDDDRGVSCVLVNTAKGRDAYSRIASETEEVAYADICTWNPALVHSCTPSERKASFFAADGLTMHEKVNEYAPLPRRTIRYCMARIYWKLRDLLRF